jgi:hypothetical protein
MATSPAALGATTTSCPAVWCSRYPTTRIATVRSSRSAEVTKLFPRRVRGGMGGVVRGLFVRGEAQIGLLFDDRFQVF